MINIIPVEKNKEYIVEIESVTSEGMGVAHIDGFCIFVAQGVTHDKVKIMILKVKSGYAYAKITELIEKSSYRTESVCSVFAKCGGCQLMHIDYEYQLKIKENIINDALRRLGGLDCKVEQMIGAEKSLRYRNKMIFPVGKDKNNMPVCGFYRERSHDIIPLDDCFLGDEVCGKIITAFNSFMQKNYISAYDEIKHKGIVRRIFIRKAYHTGEVMVVVSVNAKNLFYSDELVRILTEVSPDIKSIILNINTKKTNTVLGDKNIILYGKETIEDYLCGMKYEISPYSFFQINPEQTQKLYDKAIEFADICKNDTVMDIYCGIGTISLAAAKKAKKVVGVEIVEAAIINARKNADDNKVYNTEFYAADASEIVPELIKNGERPDIVILDPPRKGSDEQTLSAIVSAKPDRIVYVSCNPSTLARDLKFLAQNGYDVKNVCGVDMFPNTTHVECTVRLCRKD
ncbi:MAG: 23S rRNA (uracil(1939)-C(5))-methyltransferase RlmD [Clostridia bacterium]|nr:23S rRNA (uracil(1939)-C(5))-methyltransferase RlmD [Clostridia bacterium]